MERGWDKLLLRKKVFMSHRNSKQGEMHACTKTLAQIAGIATCLFLLFIMAKGAGYCKCGRGGGL